MSSYNFRAKFDYSFSISAATFTYCSCNKITLDKHVILKYPNTRGQYFKNSLINPMYRDVCTCMCLVLKMTDGSIVRDRQMLQQKQLVISSPSSASSFNNNINNRENKASDNNSHNRVTSNETILGLNSANNSGLGFFERAGQYLARRGRSFNKPDVPSNQSERSNILRGSSYESGGFKASFRKSSAVNIDIKIKSYIAQLY